MENELRRILKRHSRSLIDELAARLTSRSASRYREMDPLVLAVRCRMLVEALVRSTRHGPEQVGEFVASITAGRLAEGFELEDLQAAIRILEVNAWLLIANESTPGALTANLTMLSTTMAHARDELARTSTAYASASPRRVRRTPLELGELFPRNGTTTASRAPADRPVERSGRQGASHPVRLFAVRDRANEAVHPQGGGCPF